jgi:hypothetical protein
MEDRKLPEDTFDLIAAQVDPQEIIAIVHQHCPEWTLEEVSRRVMALIRSQEPDGSQSIDA